MSTLLTRDNIRGSLNSVIANVRDEARNLAKGPSYLAQAEPLLGAERVTKAQAAAERIASMKLSGTELPRLYQADIDAGARFVASGFERRTLPPEQTVMLWEAFGSVLAPEPATSEAGEYEYEEAAKIILYEETRRVRLAALPRGMTCGELLATDFPPPQWIVPGLLVSGLTILAGAPKLGKSWLALALGAAVGSGGAVLGRYRVERRHSLYLALEDTPRRLKNRLEKFGASSDSFLDLFTQWRSGAEGIADLDAYLEEHPDIKLVLIDTLARFRGAPSGDDRYSADYADAAAIKAVADQHDCAIVVVHHVRKMAAEDPMDTVSGTNGLNGAADSTWILTRTRGEADASLFIVGRDVEEQTLALRFDRDCGSWAVLGDAAEYAQTNERRAILRELGGGKEVRSGELARALGKSPQAISNRLRDLEAEGLIRSPKYGVWALISRVSSETVKVNPSVQREPTHLNALHGIVDIPSLFPEAGPKDFVKTEQRPEPPKVLMNPTFDPFDEEKKEAAPPNKPAPEEDGPAPTMRPPLSGAEAVAWAARARLVTTLPGLGDG